MTPTSAAAPAPVADTPPDPETPAPVLATGLKTGCQRADDDPERAGLRQGTLAIDFTLEDTNRENHTLSRLLAGKPVVLVFGSFT